MSTLKRRLIVAAGVLAIAGTGIGLTVYLKRAGTAAPAVSEKAQIWTCPMHPEIQEHGPGKCPKCGMDLVPASSLASPAAAENASETGEIARAAVQLDTRRRQMLGVRTARVAIGKIDRVVRAVGIVRYDETRLSDVNLKLDGWAKKLHVDSTGQVVRRGQPLLDLYSQDLVESENEYLLALSTRETMRDSQVPEARVQSERLVESARQRLLLWDVPADELQELERTRKSDGTVTFRSPASGFVIEKPVVEGMRVMPGQTLYKLADVSTVWVEADVFESDAAFVKVGAHASVSLDAWPGEALHGRAVYVYPFVEEKTRTFRVRFSFPNPKLRLKPGMYANVELTASLGSGLTIPADAVLDAGRQQIVFLAEGDGYYQPRTVQVGRRLGDRVQVLEGLQAGEEVATGAVFFLDSESQLRAATGAWASSSTEPAAAPAERARITFRTDSNPPRSGENAFEVTVHDASGAPVDDARVQVVLYMPAMPSMNMPAMTSEATLSPAGGGTYRGKGMVGMAGRWDVTITVTRDGRRLASTQTTLVAR